MCKWLGPSSDNFSAWLYEVSTVLMLAQDALNWRVSIIIGANYFNVVVGVEFSDTVVNRMVRSILCEEVTDGTRTAPVAWASGFTRARWQALDWWSFFRLGLWVSGASWFSEAWLFEVVLGWFTCVSDGTAGASRGSPTLAAVSFSSWMCWSASRGSPTLAATLSLVGVLGSRALSAGSLAEPCRLNATCDGLFSGGQVHLDFECELVVTDGRHCWAYVTYWCAWVPCQHHCRCQWLFVCDPVALWQVGNTLVLHDGMMAHNVVVSGGEVNLTSHYR